MISHSVEEKNRAGTQCKETEVMCCHPMVKTLHCNLED